LVANELAKLRPGKYAATVTLTYQNADSANQTATVTVQLDYKPAYVTFVAPYLGRAGQPASLIVRGVNFSTNGATLTVAIGGTEISSLVPSGDTQVRVDYPALAAGRYPVSVKNSAGIIATDAELVVLTPPALAYQAITAP